MDSLVFISSVARDGSVIEPTQNIGDWRAEGTFIDSDECARHNYESKTCANELVEHPIPVSQCCLLSILLDYLRMKRSRSQIDLRQIALSPE